MTNSSEGVAPHSATRGEERAAMVLEALRHDIVFGRLKPRERLVEEDLALRFGVGRYVVRSALDELDRQGLVRRRPNKGATVKDYSTEEVEQLYDIRSILQREAAKRISLPGAPEFVSTLRTINDAFRASGRRGDLDGASVANDLFHKTLFGACGNVFLADAIQQYWIKTSAIHCYAIGAPSLAQRSFEEHAGMVDAIETGDSERLIRLCVDHMMPALDAYKAAHGGWVNRGVAD
jgi:DNA-binding GntR family transcriptional regulator